LALRGRCALSHVLPLDYANYKLHSQPTNHKSGKKMDIEKIRAGLARHDVASISRATGINRNTIGAIRAGKPANPRLSTLKALADFIAQSEKGAE
jgi:transcriptional regulator with XRE-family HTH domain